MMSNGPNSTETVIDALAEFIDAHIQDTVCCRLEWVDCDHELENRQDVKTAKLELHTVIKRWLSRI